MLKRALCQGKASSPVPASPASFSGSFPTAKSVSFADLQSDSYEEEAPKKLRRMGESSPTSSSPSSLEASLPRSPKPSPDLFATWARRFYGPLESSPELRRAGEMREGLEEIQDLLRDRPNLSLKFDDDVFLFIDSLMMSLSHEQAALSLIDDEALSADGLKRLAAFCGRIIDTAREVREYANQLLTRDERDQVKELKISPHASIKDIEQLLSRIDENYALLEAAYADAKLVYQSAMAPAASGLRSDEAELVPTADEVAHARGTIRRSVEALQTLEQLRNEAMAWLGLWSLSSRA